MILDGSQACPKKLKWVGGKVKALGVRFCADKNEGMKMNYEHNVHKVEDILNNWQNWQEINTSWITVIKTLGLHYVLIVYMF